jgi:ParB family chromosome partitioning protein
MKTTPTLGGKMAKPLFHLDPMKIEIVGLDSPGDATTVLYDERVELEVDEAMIRNIMFYGVKVPILIRQDGDRNIVVDGRQRVRCAREANKRLEARGEVSLKVPAVPVTASDSLLTGIMISTNEQRRDDDILVKAAKAARLYEMTGDKEEVCAAFGRTPQTINGWLRLAQAHPTVHEAVRTGLLSPSAAVELAGCSRDEQVEKIATLTEEVKSAQSAAEPVAVTTKAVRESKGERKPQRGIKRSWVVKAIKTAAFKELKPSQREMLNWYATGACGEGSWLRAFQAAVWAETGLKNEDEGEVEAGTEGETKTEVKDAAPVVEGAPVKRGPGRPRKVVATPPVVTAPVVAEAVVTSEGERVTVTVEGPDVVEVIPDAEPVLAAAASPEDQAEEISF